MPEEREVELALEGLVHDLNNVFQTILESADLLDADRKWAPVARTLRRSAQRGRRIVDGYCETTTAAATCDLEVVVQDAVEFAGDVLAALRISGVEFRPDIESGLRLKGSSTTWERILFNLFINAGQAMKKAGGVVEVGAKRNGDEIEIAVTDNGPGISQEVLPHIFKPRFSTSSARTGLGLHIVRSLVRRNGGAVQAQNRTDAPGALFRITVPS
jgi:signal transduction histidine kinase